MVHSPRSSRRVVVETLANSTFSFSCTLTCHTGFVILNVTYTTAMMRLMNQTYPSSVEMQIQSVNHSPTGVILIWQVKRVTKKISQLMTKATHTSPCTHTHTQMHARTLTLAHKRLNNRTSSNAGNIVHLLKYWPDCFMITIPGFSIVAEIEMRLSEQKMLMIRGGKWR